MSIITCSKQYIEMFPEDPWYLIAQLVPEEISVCGYCGKSHFSVYKCCQESQKPYETKWCAEIYSLNRDCRHCTFGDVSSYCTCYLVNDCVRCRRCRKRLSLSTFPQQYCLDPCLPSPLTITIDLVSTPLTWTHQH